MAAEEKKLTREERLAAKLRENLHRRKAQARALGAADSVGPSVDTECKNDAGTLPKTPRES